MKIIFRLVLIAAVAALGFWFWTIFFPSPEKVILKRISSLAATATFSANDGSLTRAAKVANVVDYFAPDAEIVLDGSELANRTLSGRDEIRETTLSVFGGVKMLNVQFLDVNVRVGDGRETADVNCTAKVNTGDGKDYGVQELHFLLKKVDGHWFITRVETVKTLS
jgi:hypothetical protein